MVPTQAWVSSKSRQHRDNRAHNCLSNEEYPRNGVRIRNMTPHAACCRHVHLRARRKDPLAFSNFKSNARCTDATSNFSYQIPNRTTPARQEYCNLHNQKCCLKRQTIFSLSPPCTRRTVASLSPSLQASPQLAPNRIRNPLAPHIEPGAWGPVPP